MACGIDSREVGASGLGPDRAGLPWIGTAPGERMRPTTWRAFRQAGSRDLVSWTIEPVVVGVPSAEAGGGVR